MLKSVRYLSLAVLFVLVTVSCGAPPPKPKAANQDPTTEPRYVQAVEKLTTLARDATAYLKDNKKDDAAALITEGQPLINQVLAVPRPPLAAMEAASDLDDLYARMLLSNGHFGWARILFQKNQARWKNWQPQTEETARRRKLAADGIAECDKKILQQ